MSKSSVSILASSFLVSLFKLRIVSTADSSIVLNISIALAALFSGRRDILLFENILVGGLLRECLLTTENFSTLVTASVHFDLYSRLILPDPPNLTFSEIYLFKSSTSFSYPVDIILMAYLISLINKLNFMPWLFPTNLRRVTTRSSGFMLSTF